jgi:hypothetical protein
MLARLRALLGKGAGAFSKYPEMRAGMPALISNILARVAAGGGLGYEGATAALAGDSTAGKVGLGLLGGATGVLAPVPTTAALAVGSAASGVDYLNQPGTAQEATVDERNSPLGLRFLKQAKSNPDLAELPDAVAMAAFALKQAKGQKDYKGYIENIINPMLRAIFPNLRTSAALASVYARAYDHLTGGAESGKQQMHSWATRDVNLPEYNNPSTYQEPTSGSIGAGAGYSVPYAPFRGKSLFK